MFSRILLWFCTISITLTLLSVKLFFHNLPKLVRLLFQLIRQLLYLSYLLYLKILLWINRCSSHQTKYDFLDNPLRTIVCSGFSLLFYFLLSVIFKQKISLWCIGCSSLHGFLVGNLWKDFFEPDGLNLGERLC